MVHGPAALLAIAVFMASLGMGSAAFASCEGSISQFVPAVVGDGGGLVNVTISMAEGPGRVYTTVYPRMGVMTQESIEQAVSFAYGLSGTGETCDMLVDFGANPQTSYIDGPSAGTALAVMAYALLENRTLRNDTVITGTIEPDGSVGPVGGLYEKARGAAGMGAKYFITPVESIYEMMMLRGMEGQYGIRVVQARNVGDVIGFMTENRSIPDGEGGLEVVERGTPDVPQYDSSGILAFRRVAENMVELERGLASSIEDSGNESAEIRGFFEAEAARQDGIIEKGYLFSAANEAFLNYIDISTINAIISGGPDLARKKGEAGICLTGIRRPDLTDTNFEWVVGADQRQGWAYQRLEGTDIDESMLEDEKFAAYNELMYAQAWCVVAKELLGAAPPGGARISESAWKGIAEKRISEARALDLIDDDYVERLDIAQSNFDAGRYGAAIYDAVYVIENGNAAGWQPSEEEIGALVSEPRESLWGMVYQSHAAFLLAQNESSVAYRTAMFSAGLDAATADMADAAAAPDGSAPEGAQDAQEAGGWGNYAIPVAASLGISIFLFLVLLLILTRRTHGAYGTRFGKADRAKQKKG
ncbi:hypothetical protein L0Y65_03425 [Candidatus Micrarchaeota archaeon]|nr:hypothetical protein [Candidatus Micrarchaeota archaeon]